MEPRSLSAAFHRMSWISLVLETLSSSPCPGGAAGRAGQGREDPGGERAGGAGVDAENAGRERDDREAVVVDVHAEAGCEGVDDVTGLGERRPFVPRCQQQTVDAAPAHGSLA